MDTIEAGIFTKLLKSLNDNLKTALKELSGGKKDVDFEVLSTVEKKNGAYVTKYRTHMKDFQTGEDIPFVFLMKCKPIADDTSKLEIAFYDLDSRMETDVKTIKVDDLDKWIAKYVKWFYDNEEGDYKEETNDSQASEPAEPEAEADISEDANPSSSFRVHLEPITGSDSTRYAKLTRIMCDGTSPSTALIQLQELLTTLEFVATLTQPIDVEIADYGDELSVEDIAEPTTEGQSILETVLVNAYNLYNTLAAVHWNACGENFEELHEKLSGYIEDIQEQIDFVAELCVEFNGKVPQPKDLFSQISDSLDVTKGFNREAGYTIVREAIRNYLCCINLAYESVPSDVQSELDSIIRKWSVECNYKLVRFTL